MKKKYFLFVLFSIAFVLWPVTVDAQRHGEGPGGPPEPRGWEKVDQLRKLKLIETLGLDEEKSARLITRFSKHQESTRNLYLERGTLIDDLENAIKDSRENDYPRLIDGLVAVDRKIFEERAKFFKSLDDLLSIQQRAKFLVFERNFNRDLREMIFETKRGPGPGVEPKE